MAALTKDLNRAYRPGVGVPSKSFVVQSGETVYQGSFVGIVSDGTGKGTIFPWSIVSGRTDYWLGIAKSNVVGDGQRVCEVETSGVELVAVSVAGAASDSVGEKVYATDDGTGLTLTASGPGPVGWITASVGASKYDVRLFTPEQYRIWIAA